MSTERKILVTGGTGYIGSHTAVALVEAGCLPVLVDDFSNSRPRVLDGLREILGIEPPFHQGDCAERRFLERVVRQEGGISGAIHFAAYKAVAESIEAPLKYYRNNLGSLLNLVEVMREEGIRDLVFSSSATVYGDPQRLPVTEDCPRGAVASPYGRTKQMCEEILEDTVRSGADLRVMFLRYFNPIGAHPSGLIGELPMGVPDNLVPYVTQAAAGIRARITVFGDDYDTPDGTCIRDYIHVMDLAAAHVAALRRLDACRGSHLDVVNVGTGEGRSVMDVIRTFERVNGIRLNYEIGPRRKGDIARIYAAVEKAHRVLNWKAERSFEEALRDAWRWERRLRDEAHKA